MWVRWAKLNLDPKLGPGTYAWLELKLDSKVYKGNKGVNDSARPLEGGPAEARSLTTISLPLLKGAHGEPAGEPSVFIIRPTNVRMWHKAVFKVGRAL